MRLTTRVNSTSTILHALAIHLAASTLLNGKLWGHLMLAIMEHTGAQQAYVYNSNHGLNVRLRNTNSSEPSDQYDDTSFCISSAVPALKLCTLL